MTDEPRHELAHLGPHALRTPDPEGTLRYFTGLLGMDVVAEEGRATYLRAHGDYEAWSLKVIAAERAEPAWVSWRTWSPGALLRRTEWLETHGHRGRWIPADRGIGPWYEFTDPDGHVFRLYYGTQRHTAPPESRPVVPTNHQAYAGRGANVRRLDHVNLLARDVRACREFWETAFGLRTYEIVRRPDGHQEAAAWMSSSIQGHELIYTGENTAAQGRLHHLAYVVDSREEVLCAAEIVADARIPIEAGPSRHTAIQGFYLYTREPGGHRIEIAHGGYLVFAPDSEPHIWNAEEWKAKPGWGAPLPPEFHLYGTPPDGTAAGGDGER